MSEEAVARSLNDDLALAVNEAEGCSALEAFAVSPWIARSAPQKAIRRGRVDLACGPLSPSDAHEPPPLMRAGIPDLNRTRVRVVEIAL